MDVYEDVYSKLALSLTSAQLGKSLVVGEFGVGEDVPFMFLGWCGDELGVLMGLGSDHMGLSVLERLPFVAGVVGVMRECFWVDSVTFVAEGFLSRDVVLSSGRDLRDVFVEGGAVECLSVAHVELGVGGAPVVSLLSVPYWYEGREVVWGEGVFFERGVGRVLRDSPVLAVLVAGLRRSVDRVSLGDYVECVEGLLAEGVNVQEFLPPRGVL